jgi:hypothetical protein
MMIMYSLNAWTNPRDAADVRVYLGGTTRDKIYLKLAADGRVIWSSKTNDTPSKFRTGDHYGKVKKDGAAVRAVAAAFSIPLGDGSGRDDWARVLQLAADGIQIGPREDADEDADEESEG